MNTALDWFDKKIAYHETRIAVLRELRAEAAADTGEHAVSEPLASRPVVAPVAKPKQETPRPQSKARLQTSGDTMERIVRVLGKHGPSGPKAIAQRIERSRWAVNDLLAHDDRNLFQRSGGNRRGVTYSLTEKGRAFLATLSGSSQATG